MMMTKATPGPWTVGYLDKNGQRVVESQNIEICTCWHHSVGAIEKEMEANAHQIAAAPDLLAALKELADLMDDVIEGKYQPDSFTTQPARIAIDKAEGKP